MTVDAQTSQFMGHPPLSYQLTSPAIWVNEIHIFNCFLSFLRWLVWSGRSPWKCQKETLTVGLCRINLTHCRCVLGFSFILSAHPFHSLLGVRVLSHVHAACSHSGQLPGSQDTGFLIVAYDDLRGRIPALAWRWNYLPDGWRLQEGQSC